MEAFVGGRARGQTGLGADDLSAMEFVPNLPLGMDMLQPRVFRAKADYSGSAETALVGEPDLDHAGHCASENIQAQEEKDLSVRDDKFTSNDTLTKTVVDTQGTLKETGPTASEITLVFTTPQSAALVTNSTVASHSLNPASAPTKPPNLPSKDLNMAGRGRGGGAPGQLKNITWEPDKDLKLNSKPSELFPV